MAKKDFRGEVWNNIDPAVLSEIVKINSEAVDGKVGNDSYTARATEYLQSFFEEKISVLYTINGTAANIVALKAMLAPYGSVVCAEQTHIDTHECGALEYNTGAKIITAPSSDAKLTPESIQKALDARAGQQLHPQVVVITQPTELGTLYTLDEISKLADYAHGHGMKLFIDGARIGSALASLGVTLKEMIADTGVDVFTVGGTKAGAMFGEAVVFVHGEDLIEGDYILKQSMQHLDKSKFLGAQMLCLFEGNRWIKNFANANKMAKLIAQELTQRGIELYLPVESNMVFCILDEKTLEKMNSEFSLTYWYADRKVVRITATFSTTEEDVKKLISTID